MTDVATFTQDAAEAALKGGTAATKEMDEKYIHRRDYMKKWLTAMGFDCSRPMGAFYIFAKIPDFLEQDDAKLVYDLVKNARVAVTAGSYFGKGGDGYLRFSYATGMDQIKEGMDRLEQYINKTRHQQY